MTSQKTNLAYLVNDMGKDIKVSKKVDALYLHSPVPLLRLKKELAGVNPRDIVQIDCTDQGCRGDFENWCSRKEHTLLGENSTSDYTSYFIQKKE
ncbi:MAG: sulfurtransferase TusA family protein [bacterium]